MTAITTPRLKGSSDSLLRFALRADATASGLMGIAGIPLAGWLAEVSGTSVAFEYTLRSVAPTGRGEKRRPATWTNGVADQFALNQ